MNYKMKIHTIKWLCSFIVIMTAFPICVFTEEGEDRVPDESRLYYTIQRGDTLWDLSDKFFGLPWAWPELWQQNKEIPNPHLIYPGKCIQLFQQDWVYPPPEPVDEGALQIGEVKIELPKEEPLPPEPKEEPLPPEPKEEPPEVEKPKPNTEYFSYSRIDSTGYLLIEDKKERKKNNKDNFKEFDRPYIYKTQGNKIMISQGDLVYIRQPDKTLLSLGSRYTIYRIQELADRKTKDYIGTEYMMVGVVEITAINSPGFYEAIVLKSFRTIEKYDRLIPYIRRSHNIGLISHEDQVDTDQISGKIIAGEGNPDIFGIGHIAYIDKGVSDGALAGQRYIVYYQEKQIDPITEEEILLNPIKYGEFIVIQPRQDTSTVLITKSVKSISRGAIFKAK